MGEEAVGCTGGGGGWVVGEVWGRYSVFIECMHPMLHKINSPAIWLPVAQWSVVHEALITCLV